MYINKSIYLSIYLSIYIYFLFFFHFKQTFKIPKMYSQKFTLFIYICIYISVYLGYKTMEHSYDGDSSVTSDDHPTNLQPTRATNSQRVDEGALRPDRLAPGVVHHPRLGPYILISIIYLSIQFIYLSFNLSFFHLSTYLLTIIYLSFI